MKSLKKFLALALALALCFAMALPAMAEEDSRLAPAQTTNANIVYDLTMNELTPGHTYNVYQIFAGDVTELQADGSGKLSNVIYGTNYPGKTAGASVPQTELDILDAMTNESDAIVTWARDMAASIAAASMKPVAIITAENSVADNLPAGYYLIVDNNDAGNHEGDVVSSTMVKVLGDTTVTPKTTKPELDKKVKNVDDAAYSEDDTVSTEIGKTVQFELSATVAANELIKYAINDASGKREGKYELIFHDTMSAGLTYKEMVSILYGETELKDSGKVEIEHKGQDLTVSIANLFDIIGTDETKWTKDTAGNVVITVTYQATVNKDAVIYENAANQAQSNKAHLEYTNNPQTGGKGETQEDETFVYSFKLDITKYKDEVKDENVMEGAGFTLYYVDVAADGTKTDGAAVKFDAKNAAGNYIVDENGALTEITSAADGTLNFAGLKAGTYKLVETTVPAGFNKCADRYITITETFTDRDENGNDVNEPTGEATITQEVIANSTGAGNEGTVTAPSTGTSLEIINKKGSLLPSTGGIGTTIFYAVGGALVVGAGILLFVKKRMGSKG